MTPDMAPSDILNTQHVLLLTLCRISINEYTFSDWFIEMSASPLAASVSRWLEQEKVVGGYATSLAINMRCDVAYM